MRPKQYGDPAFEDGGSQSKRASSVHSYLLGNRLHAWVHDQAARHSRERSGDMYPAEDDTQTPVSPTSRESEADLADQFKARKAAACPS